MTRTCPACARPAGALSANPHCTSPTCRWNKCFCGATYDRNNGRGFTERPPKHYPIPA
jgi:hypothetical protein